LQTDRRIFDARLNMRVRGMNCFILEHLLQLLESHKIA
jgi:hypothetical protein